METLLFKKKRMAKHGASVHCWSFLFLYHVSISLQQFRASMPQCNCTVCIFSDPYTAITVCKMRQTKLLVAIVAWQTVDVVTVNKILKKTKHNSCCCLHVVQRFNLANLSYSEVFTSGPIFTSTYLT